MRSFGPRRFLVASSLALSIAAGAMPASAAGTWTAVTPNQFNGGPAFGLWLLTDGTVLSHGNALNHWVILTPDKTGSYANGTWKQVASSAYARGGAQEHVLKDGRFFEAGGEYLYVYPGCASGCAQPANGSALFKNVEIYDPVADTWTVEASGLYDIGDTGSATLADGRILDSTRVSNQIQIYDPSSNTWTAGASSPNPSGDENAWASLQNGGVLAVYPMGASVYNPATNSWVKTGPLPSGFAVTLTTTYPGTYDFGDTAGIAQMFDGRVMAYGLGRTAIYTPGATASDPGAWALGPDLLYKTGPNNGEPGDEAEDEYTVTEPNGKVMVATYPFGASPDLLQEYDPATNAWSEIPPPPDASGPYPVSYLNLPNGQVMVTCGSQDWVYTPDSQPQDAWRPTVTSVAYDGADTYTLTGTQISGLITGGDEGDDMTMAENYPIVWLKDSSGNVYFCKSFNFSSMMPSKGSTPETCQFTTPAGLPQGTYSLYVSAVGVQSKNAFSFTVGVGGGSTSSSSTSSGTSSSGTDAGSSGGSDASTDGAGGGSSGTSTSSSSTSSGASSSGTGSGSSGTGTSSGGPGSSSGIASSGGANAPSGGPAPENSGCACDTATTGPGDFPLALGALFAGAAAWRRRRRRSA
jgi:MYXO-CTERM domain-containing protein